MQQSTGSYSAAVMKNEVSNDFSREVILLGEMRKSIPRSELFGALLKNGSEIVFLMAEGESHSHRWASGSCARLARLGIGLSLGSVLAQSWLLCVLVHLCGASLRQQNSY